MLHQGEAIFYSKMYTGKWIHSRVGIRLKIEQYTWMKKKIRSFVSMLFQSYIIIPFTLNFQYEKLSNSTLRTKDGAHIRMDVPTCWICFRLKCTVHTIHCIYSAHCSPISSRLDQSDTFDYTFYPYCIEKPSTVLALIFFVNATCALLLIQWICVFFCKENRYELEIYWSFFLIFLINIQFLRFRCYKNWILKTLYF